MLPNTILIDSGAEVNRPENARDANTAAFNNYVPAYNCSVVSNDAFIGVRCPAAGRFCESVIRSRLPACLPAC